ncbi:hypothetical protein F2Q70_00040705 [Brassica cretica]|uniref:Uncharacterized protein n=1 Tax=Brassica cretica TaxID=69181 RepID=A0A8S9K0L7_BRACR|nr:hypothetical protein F2Q70_00040705 [Brassica cretica]
MHLGRRTLKLERAVGATSVTRAPYGVADKAIGATSQSEVRYPLRTQPLVDDFREPERPRNEADIWSDVPQRGEAPALEAERPGGAT